MIIYPWWKDKGMTLTGKINMQYFLHPIPPALTAFPFPCRPAPFLDFETL